MCRGTKHGGRSVKFMNRYNLLKFDNQLQALFRELNLSSNNTSISDTLIDYFFTYYEYVDYVLYNPHFGFYGSAKVDFSSVGDFITFPSNFSPIYGELLANHAFNLWVEMKKHRILNKQDKFYIVDIGSGDGSLALSLMNFIATKADSCDDFRLFLDDLRYLIVDRSKLLLDTAYKKCKKFEHIIDSLELDMTKPMGECSFSELKGIIFCNELIDNFPYHKIYFINDEFYISLVLPLIKKEIIGILKDIFSKSGKEMNLSSMSSNLGSYTFLTKENYKILMQILYSNHDSKLISLFQKNTIWKELFVSTEYFPPVHNFLQDYFLKDSIRSLYSFSGKVVFVSPDYLEFLKNTDKILSNGYLYIIDYGGDYQYLFDDLIEHRRIYSKQIVEDEFHSPGNVDITFDVNFSLLDEIGQLVGFNKVHYGLQRFLSDSLNLDLRSDNYKKKFVSENDIETFYKTDFKLLVHRKGCEKLKFFVKPNEL